MRIMRFSQGFFRGTKPLTRLKPGGIITDVIATRHWCFRRSVRFLN